MVLCPYLIRSTSSSNFRYSSACGSLATSSSTVGVAERFASTAAQRLGRQLRTPVGRCAAKHGSAATASSDLTAECLCTAFVPALTATHPRRERLAWPQTTVDAQLQPGGPAFLPRRKTESADRCPRIE